MIIEIINRIVKKAYITFHKILNFNLYKNNVILYGIPKLIYRERIKFGKNVRINENVFIHGVGTVEIKDNTTLSYGSSIISTGYDISTWDTNNMNKNHISRSIVIGENVWLCANVTVLSGVTISDNIVVAAGSVVNKDLTDSGYIYGGVPAKKIRKIYKG